MRNCKKMIMEAFWELLKEKSYSEITVKQIVMRCGVNRNTFYYYFQDIPSLAEEILNNKINTLIDRHCRVGSLEECISLVVQFSKENQKIVMHFYKSLPRDIFIKHLDNLIYNLVSEYIENIAIALKIEVENKEIILRFFKCLLVGVFLDWLDKEMSYDLLSDCMLICRQQKGASFQFLLNASTKKNPE